MLSVQPCGADIVVAQSSIMDVSRQCTVVQLGDIGSKWKLRLNEPRQERRGQLTKEGRLPPFPSTEVLRCPEIPRHQNDFVISESLSLKTKAKF